jgi:uncharacterized membrane protein
MTTSRQVGAAISGALLLGMGLGAFLDGIVLHQILQWHNMLSSRVPPTDLVAMKYNMVWDGLFHAFAWIATAVGSVALWRSGLRNDLAGATAMLIGSALLGWGLFNLVEGTVDHQVLGIHHVHPGADQLAWDLGFLAFGGALAMSGITLIVAGRRKVIARRAAEPGTATAGHR